MENEKINNPEINIEKFILFHRERISLLKDFEKAKKHEKLIFQIFFLGVESLASVLYREDKGSEKRFIKLLSKEIGEHDATKLYKIWRCALIHEGFIANQFTMLEAWSEEDINFIIFPKTDSIRSSVEYPSGSIIAIYENLINHLEGFFKKTNTKIRVL